MGDSLKQKLLLTLSDAVVEMDEDKSVAAAQEYIENGFDAYEGIEQGLAHGMNRASRLYAEEQYFVPELLLCSDAMYAALDILKPCLKKAESAAKKRVVIGVVQGDTHDIGKNLVKIMLETAGFDIIDLGRDVAPADFVEKAKEIDAQLIALSTLMTTTMDEMKEVIDLLKKEKIRDQFKVLVGGGPVSGGYAKSIGADGYAPNAAEATKIAKELIAKGCRNRN